LPCKVCLALVYLHPLCAYSVASLSDAHSTLHLPVNSNLSEAIMSLLSLQGDKLAGSIHHLNV